MACSTLYELSFIWLFTKKALTYWRLVESVPIQEFYTRMLLQVLLVEYNINRTGLNFNLLAIKILTRKNVLQYG